MTAQTSEWVADYLANVPSIVRRLGGTYLAVSKASPNAIKLVEGTAPVPQAIAIVSFGSIEAGRRFLNSPEYAPYKKARIAGTTSAFFAFENDDGAPQFVAQ